MTFRITTAFDVRYNCPTGHNSSMSMTNVDRQTWTCDHCHLPLKIKMRDDSGAVFVVERHPVNTLRPGDHIVYALGNGRLARAEIYVSEPATSQHRTSHWRLCVEGFGGPLIPLGQLINRL
ncbi:hypothetical protein ABRY74_23215 [Pseudomonas guariconensis]|uniref:hypothetical protein n=1 Tax=Pseudomonas guariconensis TaxID=1288410 RepID=UPI003EE3FAF7